jgi:hypothetical protein
LNAEEKKTETIRGTVVNSVTHEPIGRALVYSPDNRFAMMSDAGGHFEFEIPRAKNEAGAQHAHGMMAYYDSGDLQYYRTTGPIALMARKPGFLMDENSREGAAPSEAGQEVTIQLVPEALVIGRVNLPTADGTDQLQVELYKRLIQDGREVWNSAGTVQTTSTGEFRFAELAAGTYKVFTREEIDRDPLTFNPRGQLYGYPPVYYPLSNDFATASAIRVTAGATVNVNLSPTRREYYSVKLGVLNPPQGAGLQIEVWQQGHPGPGYSLRYDPDQQAIVGMLPDGNYTIQATAFGPIALSGQSNFNVNGGGVNGPSLNLVPGGSIRVDSARPWYAMHPVTDSGDGRSSSTPTVDRSLDVSYPATYNSGATESDGALAIELKEGDRSEVEMHLSPVPSLHMIFRIPDDDGQHGFCPPMFARRVLTPASSLIPLRCVECRRACTS